MPAQAGIQEKGQPAEENRLDARLRGHDGLAYPDQGKTRNTRRLDEKPTPISYRRDPALGETVSITPVDYGRDNPSVGALVSIDARRMALRHVHERTGLVTVHFPRFGYTVRSVAA